jgi:hypothetical protein
MPFESKIREEEEIKGENVKEGTKGKEKERRQSKRVK